ncbi:hypothetical protein ACIBSW_27240 [Actinoplanes sp. NPDC049668]|uniref:hypothetical protein n=1 Tax=unclassified Actinoplanes TaxID=2626549 RepID=UPI0033A837E3
MTPIAGASSAQLAPAARAAAISRGSQPSRWSRRWRSAISVISAAWRDVAAASGSMGAVDPLLVAARISASA